MADEQDPATPKRRLRAKQETVREKLEKSSAAADQPDGKPRRVLRGTKRGAGAPFRLGGRFFRRLNRIKVFRWIGLAIVPPYFRNSWKELRKVTWPDLRTTNRLTIAVLLFAVCFGVVIAVLDFILDKIFKQLLLK